MNPIRRTRLTIIAFVVAGSAATAALVLLGMSENINLFYPPDQVVSGEAPLEARIRAGGMVKDGSVKRSQSDLDVMFVLTDYQGSEFTVRYNGILPDLFREGQGIVAQGKINQQGIFVAQEVLAKHDENYMPPEVAEALKEAGAKHPVSIPKTTIN